MYPIRLAQVSDAAQIAVLVNQAYRPKGLLSGWTDESNLVSGNRTSMQQVNDLICSSATILVMHIDELIVACVQISCCNDGAHIGLLATQPQLQGRGIGQQMIEAAEEFAVANHKVKHFKMSVLSVRSELLAYYNRRGYQLTGNSTAYPSDLAIGVPLNNNLSVLELLKTYRA